MSRVVVGVSFARACGRPTTIPFARPRKKSKLAGLGYEKALAKALPAARHGQWFEFLDRNGHGHCQTDLLLDTELGLAVLEAKYTWTEAGHKQLEKLYKPVLEVAYPQRNILLIQVCKVLTPEVERQWVCRSLDEAVKRAFCGGRTVFHWIGAGLGPLERALPALPLAPEALML